MIDEALSDLNERVRSTVNRAISDDGPVDPGDVVDELLGQADAWFDQLTGANVSNLREQILNVVDTETREVEVPEWGVTVWVKGMTAAERDSFEADLLQGKGKNTSVNYRNMRAKLVARCVVDGEGNRVFNPEDVPALGRKSARALTRLYNVATELSGVSDDDVEELTGNSEPDQSDDSSSDWPGTSA